MSSVLKKIFFADGELAVKGVLAVSKKLGFCQILGCFTNFMKKT